MYEHTHTSYEFCGDNNHKGTIIKAPSFMETFTTQTSSLLSTLFYLRVSSINQPLDFF